MSNIFSKRPRFILVIVTLLLATIAVLIIIILGISASYILARKKFHGKSLLDIMVTIPIAVPGVVLALGYMAMAFGIEGVLGYKTGGILKGVGPYYVLIIAFSVRRFPFTVRAAYAGLQQTHETFEEAAHDLGASPPRTLVQIVIPLIGANVFGGALVSFVYSLAEASTTLVWIQTTDQATIPYLIYNFWALTVNLTFQHAAAALGIMLIIAQVIAITASNLILKRRGSALTGI